MTKDRDRIIAHFEKNAAELKPSTWRFLACELARAAILEHKENDYWQSYWVNSLAKVILEKDQDQ